MTQIERPATAPHGTEDVRASWWRDAVVYQVYVRSFADANGDGIGDLAGVRARLPYLRDLGVDAIWFNPWYPSPLADAGYDVVDYRAIDPAFGTLQQAEELIAEARELGMRTIVDVVPNHVSDRHAWFREALASPPGSPARERFWFRPGSGSRGGDASQRLAVDLRRLRLDPRRRRGVVPPPVRSRAAGPQLDAPGRLGRARGHPSLLVRPRGGGRPHRLGRAAREGPEPHRDRPPEPSRRRIRSWTATSCTRSTAAGARSRTVTTIRAYSSVKCGLQTPSGSPATSAPTSCTPRSTSTSSRARGSRCASAHRSSRRWRPTPRSTRRRRGCCRTTTSHGQ